MLSFKTTIDVEGMSGAEVFDFLANPDDESYQAWWPGTHLALHVQKRGHDHVGDAVYMDEYIGKRRLRMTWIVTEAIPGKRIAMQAAKGIKLPSYLYLDLEDHDGGVRITHITTAGFPGTGRVLDPVVRLYFSKKFAADLDEHARTEFPRLRDLLRERRRPAAGSSAQ